MFTAPSVMAALIVRWFCQSPTWHTSYKETSANCLVRFDFRSPCNEGNAPLPLHEPQGFPANVPDPLQVLQRPVACSGIAISPCVEETQHNKRCRHQRFRPYPKTQIQSGANQEYGYQGGDDEYAFGWNHYIVIKINIHHLSVIDNARSPDPLVAMAQGYWDRGD